MQALYQFVYKVSGAIFGTTEEPSTDESSGSVKAVPARRTKRNKEDSSDSKSKKFIPERRIKPLKKPPAPTSKSAVKRYGSDSSASGSSSSEDERPQAKQPSLNKRKALIRGKPPAPEDSSSESADSRSERTRSDSGFSSSEDEISEPKPPVKKTHRVKTRSTKRRKPAALKESSAKYTRHHSRSDDSDSELSSPESEVKIRAIKRKKTVDVTASSVESESSSEGKRPKSKPSPAKKRKVTAPPAKQKKAVSPKHTSVKTRDSSPEIISSDSAADEQELNYSQVFTSEVPEHSHKKQRIISQKDSLKLVNVRVSMRAVELDRLAPKGEIDDSLITLAFALLTQRQNKCPIPVVCLFKSGLFFNNYVLVDRGVRINTSPYERIFFPVHLPEHHHWILLVVDKDNQAIYRVDSLHLNHGEAEANILRLWLSNYADDDCDFYNFRIRRLNPPGQGTNDCGPALIWAADQLSKNKEIRLPKLNGPATYRQYRKDIRKTLIHYCTLRYSGELTPSRSNEDSDCMIVEYLS